MSDPQKYRTKEEVSKFKERDPLNNVLNKIYEYEMATEEDIEKIGAKVKDIVNESVQFAEESPAPSPSELYEDVYTQKDYPYIMDNKF